MFQDQNSGQVFSRSCYWNCLVMWGKEAHVILLCFSLAAFCSFHLIFSLLLLVLTRFSRVAKASELLSFYKFCAISWDRNVCTGSEQMSSKCLHDNGHKKMVRKIIQEQSEWKLCKKFVRNILLPVYFPSFWLSYYVLPAPHLYQSVQSHLFAGNRHYLKQSCEIWLPFMKDSSFYWISSTWTNISGFVPGAEIRLHNFKVQRRRTFCVPSSFSLMLLLLCTAPPKRAVSWFWKSSIIKYLFSTALLLSQWLFF